MAKNRIGFSSDFVLNGGKVGIATTNPLQTLHVEGNFLVAAGTTTGKHITLKPYDTNNGTLSWEGSAGQLFSITNNLTEGSIFTINDSSAVPIVDALADGTVQLVPYGGEVAIGKTTASYTVDVRGTVKASEGFYGDAFNAYPFYSGITSSVFASPNGVLNSVIGFPTTSDKRYIVHSINVANVARVQPTGAGASVSINPNAGAVTSLTINGVGVGYTAGDIGSPSNLNVSFATTSFVGVGTTGDPAYAGITSALGYVTAVSGGRPTGVAITFGGFGYTSAPVVTFADPAAGGTTETGTAILTLGEVTAAFLNTPGEGYTTPPTVSIASTTGTGAQITADVDSDGRVIRLNLINRGYGYSKSNALGNNEENEVYITKPPLAKTEVGVDVEIDRVPVGGGTTVPSYLAFDVPIPIGGVIEILKQPAVMNPGDIIKIRGVDADGSGLNNAIDVSISYEETHDNYVGYGTATPPNVGLGTAINNIVLISADDYPILVQSIRLTNTEFVGDYDVSIRANRPNSLTYNCTVPTTISAGSTIIFVDNLTNNSLETAVKPGNLVGIATTATGSVLLSTRSVVSVGNTFVTVATGSVDPIPAESYVTFTIDDDKYLARNLIIPSFASVELCDTPKRIERGITLYMDAETVGIDTNIASTIDINISGRNIII